MCFAGYLYYHFNAEVASLFLAGYLFEQALSVDNLFVMMAIFAWFKVPEQYCHRVLYWGVLGAIFFRLLFVVIGSALFALGPAVEVVFALLVAASGVMMLRRRKMTMMSTLTTATTSPSVQCVCSSLYSLV